MSRRTPAIRNTVIGLVVLVCSVLTWIVVFKACMRSMPPSVDRPSWTNQSPDPPPESWFRIAAFPKSEVVPLFDKPAGQAIGILGRAISNGPAEVKSGGWIGVNQGGGQLWVRSADLVLLPAEGVRQPLLDALSSSLKVRTGDQYSGVRVTVSTVPEGQRVTFRIRGEKGWQESIYLVNENEAIPEQLFLVSEAGAGLNGFVDFISYVLSVAGATVGAGVVALLVYLVLRLSLRAFASAEATN